MSAWRAREISGGKDHRVLEVIRNAQTYRLHVSGKYTMFSGLKVRVTISDGQGFEESFEESCEVDKRHGFRVAFGSGWLQAYIEGDKFTTVSGIWLAVPQESGSLTPLFSSELEVRSVTRSTPIGSGNNRGSREITRIQQPEQQVTENNHPKHLLPIPSKRPCPWCNDEPRRFNPTKCNHDEYGVHGR
jgi:hypothetical protein